MLRNLIQVILDSCPLNKIFPQASEYLPTSHTLRLSAWITARSLALFSLRSQRMVLLSGLSVIGIFMLSPHTSPSIRCSVMVHAKLLNIAPHHQMSDLTWRDLLQREATPTATLARSFACTKQRIHHRSWCLLIGLIKEGQWLLRIVIRGL